MVHLILKDYDMHGNIARVLTRRSALARSLTFPSPVLPEWLGSLGIELLASQRLPAVLWYSNKINVYIRMYICIHVQMTLEL